MSVFFLIIADIAFMFFLWHMDVNHNIDRMGGTKTRGVFKMSPEAAYRWSQYGLLTTLVLLNVLFFLT
jgi:hypothetical protein